MQQLNKVELIGYVGSVRRIQVSEATCIKFTVATNFVLKDKDKNPIITTTWHNIACWISNKTEDADKLSKGDHVKVLGRITNQRFTDIQGNEHSVTEIVATSVQKLQNPLSLNDD